MNQQDYAELKRLDAMGMKRVICDVEGQRGGVDDFGHIELVEEGMLMDATPFSPIEIKNALRAEVKSA